MLDQLKCSDRLPFRGALPDALLQLAPFSEGPATCLDFDGFGGILFRETAPDATIDVCLRWASTLGDHAGRSIVLACGLDW